MNEDKWASGELDDGSWRDGLELTEGQVIVDDEERPCVWW